MIESNIKGYQKNLQLKIKKDIIILLDVKKQAHNSVGRVIALQAIGHRFKSGWA